MDTLRATVLGIVQGLTEFLPVSSSGHLVLVNYHLGWGVALPPWVTFATNTGTLLAVLIYLRADVWRAVRGAASGLVSREARQGPDWRLALLVLVGSVPTAAIGLGLRSAFDRLNQPLPVALALLATGLVLVLAPKSGPKREPHQLSFRDALWAGFAQGLAVVPGISRSGATIAMLLWRGASSDVAPRMSFLLYLVVSVGVALLTVDEVLAADVGWAPLLAMTLSSFAVGYVALMVLFAVLRRGRFWIFAPYVWIVAALTLLRVALA